MNVLEGKYLHIFLYTLFWVKYQNERQQTAKLRQKQQQNMVEYDKSFADKITLENS